MRYLATLSSICLALPLLAGPFEADVVVLGEVHDNPHHHARQAEIITEVQPKAIVFEMLTEAQAAAHLPGADADALNAAFGWADSGWPDFAMYFPIFEAAPSARVYGGGIPRPAARAAMQTGLAEAFGAEAQTYGLLAALPKTQQTEREALQKAAHCDALPEDLLPAMVDIQRLRDAALARAAAQAFAETGGPVAVITGNGHARLDWGMPVYLQRAQPELRIIAIGQGEDGRPPAGQFSSVEDAPSIARPDPCAAFQ